MSKLTWGWGVFALSLLFLAALGVYRLTHDVTQGTAQSQSSQTSPFYAPGIILDLQAPLRPVVEGTFTYNGPGGTFVQRFRGVFDTEGTCADYAKGAGGRLQTPYALYLKGTKLQRSLNGRVTIAAYKGPGIYTSTQVEGELGARDGNGKPVGSTSPGAKATFLVTTKADGSGSVTFTGPNAGGQTISGVMSWTCEDSHIDLNAYSLTPY